MLYSLYKTNDKFKLLMSEFNNIVITKSIHKDNYYKNLHFTGYLQNTINNIKTSQLHFYFNDNNIIYDITKINSII